MNSNGVDFDTFLDDIETEVGGIRNRKLQAEGKQAAQERIPVLSNVGAGISDAVSEVGSLVTRPFNPRKADEMNRELARKEQVRMVADTHDHVPDVLQSGTRGAARSITTAAAMAPLGSYGIIGGFAASEANRAATDAKDAGLRGRDKWKYVGRAAAIEGGVAGAFQLAGLGGFEKLMGGGAITRAGIKGILKQTGVSMLQELPEENLTEILHLVNADLSGIDPDALTAERIRDTLFQTTVQTMMTVASTSVGNGILNQPSIKAREQMVAGMAAAYGFDEQTANEVFDRAAKAKGDFEQNLGRELQVEAKLTGEPLKRWAAQHTEHAQTIAGLDKPSQSDFDRAGLPKRSRKARKRIADELKGFVGEAVKAAEKPVDLTTGAEIIAPIAPVEQSFEQWADDDYNTDAEIREWVRAGYSEDEAREIATPLSDDEWAEVDRLKQERYQEYNALQQTHGDNTRAILREMSEPFEGAPPAGPDERFYQPDSALGMDESEQLENEGREAVELDTDTSAIDDMPNIPERKAVREQSRLDKIQHERIVKAQRDLDGAVPDELLEEFSRRNRAMLDEMGAAVQAGQAGKVIELVGILKKKARNMKRKAARKAKKAAGKESVAAEERKGGMHADLPASEQVEAYKNAYRKALDEDSTAPAYETFGLTAQQAEQAEMDVEAEGAEALEAEAEHDEYDIAGNGETYGESSLEENLARSYHNYANFDDDPGAFVSREDIVKGMRHTLEGDPDFKGDAVSDEQILEAAKDVYEARQRLFERKKTKKPIGKSVDAFLEELSDKKTETKSSKAKTEEKPAQKTTPTLPDINQTDLSPYTPQEHQVKIDAAQAAVDAVGAKITEASKNSNLTSADRDALMKEKRAASDALTKDLQYAAGPRARAVLASSTATKADRDHAASDLIGWHERRIKRLMRTESDVLNDPNASEAQVIQAEIETIKARIEAAEEVLGSETSMIGNYSEEYLD